MSARICFEPLGYRAVHAGDQPYLGSALMHHTDPAVAEEHYNRSKCASAAQKFADLIMTLRNEEPSPRHEADIALPLDQY